MSNVVVGLLCNLEDDIETSSPLANICSALSENEIEYCFLSEFKNDSEINQAHINMLFTINDWGIEKWKYVINNPIPLVVWNMGPPLKALNLIKNYYDRQWFIFLSSSNLDLNYIHRKFPNVKTKFLPVAYTPNILADNQQERIYDIVYVNSSMYDVESYDTEMRQAMEPDAYEIISEIVQFALRNPEVSLWDTLNYYSMIYHYKEKDYELYIDTYEKVGSYITNLKCLKVLSQLKDINIKIWGSPVWKKYIQGNLQYMGEIDYKSTSNLFRQSKIVLNIDNIDRMLALNDLSLLAMASGSLLFTDYNSQMQYHFPKKDFDIYYDVNNLPEAVSKINYYLKNYDETVKLTDKLQNLVERDHTWKARITQLFSVLVGEK